MGLKITPRSLTDCAGMISFLSRDNLKSSNFFAYHVQGLNVINDPKCNKVLNVITFCPKCNKVLIVITFCPKCNKLVANYSNYSNKRRIWRGFNSAAAPIRVNTVLRGIAMVLIAALK